MLAVEPGTGSTKFVLPAQINMSSTLMEFVSLFLINADNTLKMVIVPPVTKDMI